MNRIALYRIYLFTLISCFCLYFLKLPVAQAEDELAYHLKYKLELLPDSDQARVSIAIDKGKLIHSLSFENPHGRYSDISANGSLSKSQHGIRWQPPAKDAKLSLKVKITHERDPGEYDAMMTKHWAIFRGDDVFPSVATKIEDGAYAIATLEVALPPGWTSIETGWPRKKDHRFRINNPKRKFDRPTGWMIAGSLGTRREEITGTAISVSAPKDSHMRRMDVITFFNFVWPQLKQAFRKAPKKLLVVGMDDPMWRGGLSASNSIFLHSDRPIVSENGTSPLMHELTHMVTRIRGLTTKTTNDDWIAEGLAEFYSFELIYRSGGMTDQRRDKIITKLGNWGKDVKHLRKQESSGEITARAVVLLNDLDKEIQRRSKNKYSIDHVTRDLMEKGKVSLDDLEQSVEQLLGAKSKTLRSPLLE